MSDKPTVEELIEVLECHLGSAGSEEAWTGISAMTLGSLLVSIREMQEEIKQDKKAMQAAIDDIDEGVIGLVRVRLAAHLAKDQPKDDGTGGETE